MLQVTFRLNEKIIHIEEWWCCWISKKWILCTPQLTRRIDTPQLLYNIKEWDFLIRIFSRFQCQISPIHCCTWRSKHLKVCMGEYRRQFYLHKIMVFMCNKRHHFYNECRRYGYSIKFTYTWFDWYKTNKII